MKKKRKKTRYPGVYRLPDGRLQIRTTATCRRTGKLREVVRTLEHGTGEEGALRELAALKEAIRNDGVQAEGSSKMSVTDYAVQWLRGKAARSKPGTADRYRGTLERFIVPELGHLLVDKVDRADVERWVAWAERVLKSNGEPYARETVLGWWRVLCSLLGDAKAEFGLPVDPTERVRPPDPHVPPCRETRTLSAEELGRLLEQVRKFAPQRYAEVCVLAFTGMRPGEMYALKREDIDHERGRILVRRAVYRGYEGLPKTGEPREGARWRLEGPTTHPAGIDNRA